MAQNRSLGCDRSVRHQWQTRTDFPLLSSPLSLLRPRSKPIKNPPNRAAEGRRNEDVILGFEEKILERGIGQARSELSPVRWDVLGIKGRIASLAPPNKHAYPVGAARRSYVHDFY